MSLSYLRKLLFPIYSQYIGRVIVTEGSSKEGGKKIKILYLRDYITREYLSDFAYDKPPKTIANELALFSHLPATL